MIDSLFFYILLCYFPGLLLVAILCLIFPKYKNDWGEFCSGAGWLMIIAALLQLSLVLRNPDYAFLNRATGPYAGWFWLILLLQMVLPLFLLFRKVRQSLVYSLMIGGLAFASLYVRRYDVYLALYISPLLLIIFYLLAEAAAQIESRISR